MIEHVFDPANNLSAVSVKVEPGAVFIGPTNFIDLESVTALQLSPIQLSLLIVALQRAQAAEFELAQAWEKYKETGPGDELL